MPFDGSPETNGRERVRQLAEHLRELPEARFDMGAWGMHRETDAWVTTAATIRHDCGTMACIAGWACALFAPATEYFEIEDQAADLLGLNHNVARTLFLPLRTGLSSISDIPPAQAARVLDHLYATGEVDWDAAFTEAPIPVS